MSSRARRVAGRWWLRDQINHRATVDQIELLAAWTGVSFDDLVDAGLTQREVVERLRLASGEHTCPAHVLVELRARRAERRAAPPCRVCGRVGDSSLHHFVNRWMLAELEHYEHKWASRARNCIPVCRTPCHDRLHAHADDLKSIVPYLLEDERLFASMALATFEEEHPATFELLAEGDGAVRYEARLVRDYLDGLFEPGSPVAFAGHLRAVTVRVPADSEAVGA